MQNFSLLRKLARVSKPILLKRGPSATVKEWLLAAEYLLAGGNANVVLCERGIKTFETATRNTLDLAAVALAKELSHLPVLAELFAHRFDDQAIVLAVLARFVGHAPSFERNPIDAQSGHVFFAEITSVLGLEGGLSACGRPMRRGMCDL